MKFLHGCRLVIPEGLLPLRPLFLDALPPLDVGGTEDEADFGVGFLRLSPSETTLVSSQALSFCFPFVAFSLSSLNATKSPATRDHCFCLTSRVSGIKIPWSKSLINASLHHRLQFLKIGHRYLLMNLHFVQFQYGFELRGVTYSQFVQTFLDIIGRKLWHW